MEGKEIKTFNSLIIGTRNKMVLVYPSHTINRATERENLKWNKGLYMGTKFYIL